MSKSLPKPGGFWIIFAYIAITTGVLFALSWSALFTLFMGWDFGFVLRFGGIWAGIGFGLIFGFVMAFQIRSMTMVMQYNDKTIFLAKLNLILAELGYHAEIQTEDLISYKPSLRAGILAGKISIQLDQNSAVILGPSVYIRKIQDRLPLFENLNA